MSLFKLPPLIFSIPLDLDELAPDDFEYDESIEDEDDLDEDDLDEDDDDEEDEEGWQVRRRRR